MVHEMETESVRSTFSENSLRKNLNSQSRPVRSNNSHRSYNSRARSRNHSRSDMTPYQTSVTMEDGRDGREVIEVQILPQDENWGENTTAITGNTSDQSGSIEEMALWPDSENDLGISVMCKSIASLFTRLLIGFAFLSPLLMIVFPKIGIFPSLVANMSESQKAALLSCRVECKGMLVTFTFKMVLLAIAYWAIFWRSEKFSMPSIFLFRVAGTVLVLVATIAYWLFYLLQVTEGARGSLTGEDQLEYQTLVSYASSYLDILLFIHYVAVILIEIRHLRPKYYIKVIRSPDGESKSYAIGCLSIQRAAVWILEKYYTEFSIYNPYLERLPISKSKKSSTSFKFYDVDGFDGSNLQNNQSRSVLNGHSKRRDSSHNERFYEEHDYERRVKKRKARLITAAEDAFTHIKRINHDPPGGIPMDAKEAAQAVFPSLARALQKYLRVTRQQPRHTMESTIDHLAICLTHDLSPKAFLESFLVESPVLQNEKEQKDQKWSLICNELLNRPIRNGIKFQLRQNDISLLCSVHSLPNFDMTEEMINPQSNRFVFRLSSETSV